MRTNDDLYNANTGQVDLAEGEIVIASIATGTTESYTLDLGTNPVLAKDWLLEYFNTFFSEWPLTVYAINTDNDGYNFEGNESYTITIESTVNISIAQDVTK